MGVATYRVSNDPSGEIIGQSWVGRGFRTTPIAEYPDPCIICGVPLNACTEDHSNEQ